MSEAKPDGQPETQPGQSELSTPRPALSGRRALREELEATWHVYDCITMHPAGPRRARRARGD